MIIVSIMETNRLRQFCVVVETGNLRKAAGILGISHSGLSKSLKTLEIEVGKELTQISGRGIVITDFGKKFYERSQPFFNQLDHLLEGSEGQAENNLRIGSFEVFTTYFLGQVISEFDEHQGIELRELVPGKLEQAIVRDDIDMGITYHPIPQSGLEYLKVAKIKMGIFGTHAMKCEKELPFVIPTIPLSGSPTGVKGLDSWPDEKIKRNICFQVTLMESALEIMRNGRAVGFIPHFIAKLHNERVKKKFELIEFPLPKGMKKVKRDVYIVKRESTREDSNFKRMAKVLRLISRIEGESP